MTTTSSDQRTRSFSSDGRSARSARQRRRRTTVRPARSRSSARRTSRRRSPSSGRASLPRNVSTGRIWRRRRRRSTKQCTPTTFIVPSGRKRTSQRASHALCRGATQTRRASPSSCRSRPRLRDRSRGITSPAGTDTDTGVPLRRMPTLQRATGRDWRGGFSSCAHGPCARAAMREAELLAIMPQKRGEVEGATHRTTDQAQARGCVCVCGCAWVRTSVSARVSQTFESLCMFNGKCGVCVFYVYACVRVGA